MRILNIDDSTINNMLMENLLATHGFESLSVIEGKKVAEQIEEFKPDVILLDLMIPDKSGLEILKDIKARGISIPVVVITAMESKEIRKEIESLGVIAIHSKPVQWEQLIESIQKAAKDCQANNNINQEVQL
jgi:CheY-like chemotaxis protein